MIFDSHFWIFSLFASLVGAAFTAFLIWNPEKLGCRISEPQTWTRKNLASIEFAAVLSFVVTLLAVRTLLYYGMPVFQGSFFGYFEVLLVVLLSSNAVAWLLRMNPGNIKYLLLCYLGLFIMPVSIHLMTANWGKTNSKRYAELPNIRQVADTETLPPTDPSHMVLVNRDIAVFQGAKILQGEISSRYTIDKDSYTLQSIAGHRYWVAPLTLINTGDTLNWSNPESPGYVVVDAENPEADPKLKTGFHIKLFNDQSWALFVKRHAYQHGFSDMTLGKAFFEVDDDWQPYWTFAYIKKPFGGMNGKVVDKIVMVNVAEAEPQVTSVNPKDKPDWLDRVIDQELVFDYATDWGLYGRGHSKDYWPIFFNWNREGTLQPADVELNYTSDADNVWVVPMTATTGSHAVQGVLVFDTNRNDAKYYPGLNNFYIGESVRSTMFSVKENVMRYTVQSVQLYSIYGELTWVGIYVAPQADGGSFAGIGLLHAHSQNPADVIFSTNKTTALSRYANQLANRKQSGQIVSTAAKASKFITATIGRIAALPGSEVPTYLFVVPGDKNTYRVTRETFSRIPLIKEGDVVKFSYMDTNEEEEAVGSFSCVKCAGLDSSLPAEVQDSKIEAIVPAPAAVENQQSD